jgi:hypothetical protein
MKNRLLALAVISEVATGLTLLVVPSLVGTAIARHGAFRSFRLPLLWPAVVLHAVLTLLARRLGSPSGIARIATRNETRIELERLHVQIQQK